jgi:hypothetical protein
MTYPSTKANEIDREGIVYSGVDYRSAGAAMSESQPSDIGGPMVVRIFVGARTVDVGMSGIEEPARDGAAEAPNDEAAFEALPLLDRPAVEIEISLGRLKPDSLVLACAGTPPAAASSDSFSPTQERANHRPPPIPRISRLAIRQCLTFLPLLSKGSAGAKPEWIFGRGWTGKGFVGRG